MERHKIMKDSLDDELKDISPWLRDQKQADDGFQIPDGYFDALEERIFARIDAEGARRAPEMNGVRGGGWAAGLLPRMAWAAAAASAAVLATVWLLRPPSEMPIAAADLTEEDAAAYVADNAYEFELDQLAAIPAEDMAQWLTEPASPATSPTKAKRGLDDVSPEEMDKLLNEMSDEELESLL